MTCTILLTPFSINVISLFTSKFWRCPKAFNPLSIMQKMIFIIFAFVFAVFDEIKGKALIIFHPFSSHFNIQIFSMRMKLNDFIISSPKYFNESFLAICLSQFLCRRNEVSKNAPYLFRSNIC